MNTKILLGLCGLILLGGAAFGAAQEGGRGRPDGAPRARQARTMRTADRDGASGRGMRERLRQGRKLVRSLDVTPAQRELVREAARELAPLSKDLRQQARTLLEKARTLRRDGDREGARAVLRNELRPMLDRAKPDAERAASPVLRSLTPEQRTKLEAAAQRRGKQFDEQRFAQRLGLALTSRRGQRRGGQTR